MKKAVLIWIILLILNSMMGPINIVYADSDDSVLDSTVEDKLNNIDFGELDYFLDTISKEYGISDIDFGNNVMKLLRGEFDININNVFKSIIDLVLDRLYDILPTVISIIVIALICSYIVNLGNRSSSSSKMIDFISTASVIIIVIVSFKYIVGITSSSLEDMSKFVSILSPILLSIFSAIGSVSSIGVFTSLFALIGGVVCFVFENILFPIILISFVLLICSSLGSYISLSRLNAFFSNAFKFVLGITFTVFLGFMGLQSIAISKFDTIGIRATKYAISSYIPFIGSYLSQGFDYVMMGSMIIKNGIGIMGIIVIILLVFSSILSLVVIKLTFDFLSGVLEFMGNDTISSFLSKFSKILTLPIILILSITFIYIVALVIIISTANLGVV